MSHLNAQIIRLYDTVFDRAPDAGGLEFWNEVADRGLTLNGIAIQFITAPEFALTYGQPTNTLFVQDLYRNVLDRAGEAEGVAFWTRHLDEGLASRSDIVVSFSESAEHVAHALPPTPTLGHIPTTNAVSGVVPALPMYESFENSIGPFTENWGVDFSTFGEARFFGNQYSTAGMKEPGADPSIGHGYGTYTVNAMLTGNTAGPAVMLWPGDNKYPGAEIDLAELKPDGTEHQYATIHWNENGQNGQQQYYFDDVRSGVFHTYQAVWEPGKITLSIDNHITAVVTEHVPVDYNHGGVNETFAFLNINDATSLVVRDVSFAPL